MTAHGQTVYDAHHAEMHQQTGRRQSHHKTYENLTPAVRARYDAAGQKVAGPLEAEIARLRELLDEIGVMAANAPEDEDSFGVCEQIAMRVAAVDVPLDEPETNR